MIYHHGDRKLPWPKETEVRIVQLIADTLYMPYAEKLKDQVAIIDGLQDDNLVLLIPTVMKSNGVHIYAFDDIEIVRLDDPDDNY